jgi:1,4-alpha-glucan branching enzyme
MHAGMQRVVRALNRLYAGTPSLHRRDASPDGFRWVIGDDAANSVLAFLRLGREEDPPVLAVCNFTPVVRHDYRIGVPRPGFWREALNTDAAVFGGSNVGNMGGASTEPVPAHGYPQSLSLTLPPLATLLLIHQPG